MKNAKRQQQQQKAQPTAAQAELMSCSSMSKRKGVVGQGSAAVNYGEDDNNNSNYGSMLGV